MDLLTPGAAPVLVISVCISLESRHDERWLNMYQHWEQRGADIRLLVVVLWVCWSLLDSEFSRNVRQRIMKMWRLPWARQFSFSPHSECCELLYSSRLKPFDVGLVTVTHCNGILVHVTPLPLTIYRVSQNWVLTLFCLFSRLPELIQTFILPFFNSLGDEDSQTRLTFLLMSKIDQVTEQNVRQTGYRYYFFGTYKVYLNYI